jgi:hypothetical protein
MRTGASPPSRDRSRNVSPGSPNQRGDAIQICPPCTMRSGARRGSLAVECAALGSPESERARQTPHPAANGSRVGQNKAARWVSVSTISSVRGPVSRGAPRTRRPLLRFHASCVNRPTVLALRRRRPQRPARIETAHPQCPNPGSPRRGGERPDRPRPFLTSGAVCAEAELSRQAPARPVESHAPHTHTDSVPGLSGNRGQVSVPDFSGFDKSAGGRGQPGRRAAGEACRRRGGLALVVVLKPVVDFEAAFSAASFSCRPGGSGRSGRRAPVTACGVAGRGAGRTLDRGTAGDGQAPAGDSRHFASSLWHRMRILGDGDIRLVASSPHPSHPNTPRARGARRPFLARPTPRRGGRAVPR